MRQTTTRRSATPLARPAAPPPSGGGWEGAQRGSARQRQIIAAAIQCVGTYIAVTILFTLAGLALGFSPPESLALAFIGVICTRIIEQTAVFAVERIDVGRIRIEFSIGPAYAAGGA